MNFLNAPNCKTWTSETKRVEISTKRSNKFAQISAQIKQEKLMNAVHKNLRHLVCMRQYLTTYAIPSASMLGYAKRMRRGKGAKKSMQDPDASQDPASQLENPDGQCRGLVEVPGRGLAAPAAKKHG